MKKKGLFFLSLYVTILIFSFIPIVNSESRYLISGYVTTKDSNPIRRIKVELLNGDHILENDDTNLLGYYRIDTKLEENTEYTLRFSDKKIQEHSIRFETTQFEISIDAIVNQIPDAKINGPEIGFPLDELIFNASSSYDSDGDPLQFHWDFGDGETSEEITPAHIYTKIGEYTVTLQVVDNDGASDATTEKIDIRNRAPIATHNGPYTARINTTVQFSSDGSYDPDVDPIDIKWEFGDGAKANEPNPSHVYMEAGEYKVKLIVSDIHGEKDEKETKCIVANNLAPIAVANGPYQGYQGIQLQLSSEGTHDPDGEIKSYLWELGDGRTSIEKSPKIIFQEKGTFSAKLTVTDNDGEKNTDTTTIEVLEIENLPPNAEVNGPYTGELNEYIKFSSLGSYDPNNETINFIWDFGNGETTNESNPSYKYSQIGTYIVTLTVIDPHQVKNWESTTCKITQPSITSNNPTPPNQKPYAIITLQDEGETGQEIFFNSSYSYDPDGAISKFYWEFGDGKTSDNENPTHIYEAEGIYPVILTIIDDQGKKDSNTVNIQISNPNIYPILSLNETYIAKTNESINFTPIECYDPDGNITLYNWEFGDNTTSNMASPTHYYTYPGTYNLKLTVTDDKSEEAQGKSTIHIENNIPPVGIIKSTNSSKIGEIITFSAQNSYDTDGEIIQYTWDFNDGSFSYSSKINHTYLTEGEKNVTLVIVDDNKEEIEVQKKILVSKNVPPTIKVNNSRKGQVYEKLLFGSNSIDSDGKIIALLWEFGDGASATGEIVYHSYERSGVYRCTITATDDNFEESSEIIQVTIYEESETEYPILTITVTAIFAIAYILKDSWFNFIQNL